MENLAPSFSRRRFSRREREKKKTTFTLSRMGDKKPAEWNLKFLSSARGEKRVLKGENERKSCFFVAPRTNTFDCFIICSQKRGNFVSFSPLSVNYNSSIFIKRRRNINTTTKEIDTLILFSFSSIETGIFLHGWRGKLLINNYNAINLPLSLKNIIFDNLIYSTEKKEEEEEEN